MVSFFKISCAVALLVPLLCFGQATSFTFGPVFKHHGQNVLLEGALENPTNQHFKVAFDISQHSDKGQMSRNFNTAARFINMHVRAGVPIKNIELALVVHGKASFDLLTDAAHQKTFNQVNTNTQIMKLLLANNVKIYICGQSAMHLGIPQKDLFQGVEMSLSAMTAHALLQQDGFTLNPF